MKKANMKLNIVQENWLYKRCLSRINLTLSGAILQYELYYKYENSVNYDRHILIAVSINLKAGTYCIYPITTRLELLQVAGPVGNIRSDLETMLRTSPSMEN